MPNLYLYNIGQIVTRPGSTAQHDAEAMRQIGVVEGPAAITVRQGKIVFVGTIQEAEQVDHTDCVIYDAQGGCILPGFVDSHTHLIFGGYRGDELQWRLADDSYMSIMERDGGIANTMKATRSTTAEELTQRVSAYLDAMLSMGVTTAKAKSGYGMELDAEIKQLEVIRTLQRQHPINLYPTFMGAHDTPSEYKGRSTDFIYYLCDTVMSAVVERGLVECCDIFTEQGVFDHEQTRILLTRAKELGLKAKMHADEIVSFGGTELAAELGCFSAGHLLQISDRDIQALAQSDTVATCLPCTAFSLGERYTPTRRMIDAGCAVAVASDLNPGSCFSSFIPLMFVLATIYMDMIVEEATTVLTLNDVAATGRADQIGGIEVGKVGGLALPRFPSHKFLSYHFRVNLVRAATKAGTVYENKLVTSTPSV